MDAFEVEAEIEIEPVAPLRISAFEHGMKLSLCNVLAMASVMAALPSCSTDLSGPVTELRIESVRPERIGPGDEVTVSGAGMHAARIFLDGREMDVVQVDRDRATFVAPLDLPECRADLPGVFLSARYELLRDSVRVAASGPVRVDLRPGEHRVMEVGSACAVELRHAGTYGVAVYRPAPERNVSDLERSARHRIGVNLRGGAPSAAASRERKGGFAVPATAFASSRHRPLPTFAIPATAATGEQCLRSPLSAGNVIHLAAPFGTNDGDFQVMSASTHFAVLVALDSLPNYSVERRNTALGLADILEGEVYPFLSRIFGTWPDADGDGQLHVLFVTERSASYSGGYGFYEDGCAGDFVRLGHQLLDNRVDAEFNYHVDVVVHEAAHWYDIGPDLSHQTFLPDWSREGYATLVERIWRWQRTGRDFRGNQPVECPPGATCERILLEQDRYGSPGLSLEGGYGHGSYILQYLVEQAVDLGVDRYDALGGLPGRASASGSLGMRRAFEAAGGSGRTEAELQGEYLLSFHADDHVAGVSSRLVQYAWNLPAQSPRYPLRSLILDAVRPDGDIHLAVPDGVVIEVWSGEGGRLSFSEAPGDLAVAVVRAQ